MFFISLLRNLGIFLFVARNFVGCVQAVLVDGADARSELNKAADHLLVLFQFGCLFGRLVSLFVVVLGRLEGDKLLDWFRLNGLFFLGLCGRFFFRLLRGTWQPAPLDVSLININLFLRAP